MMQYRKKRIRDARRRGYSLMTKSFYEKALQHFGIEDRADKLIKEMAELIVALKHYKDNKTTKNHVIKEIADVHVLLNTVAFYFDTLQINQRIVDIELKVDAMIDADCRKNVGGAI